MQSSNERWQGLAAAAVAAHQSDTLPPGQKARPNTKGSPCRHPRDISLVNGTSKGQKARCKRDGTRSALVQPPHHADARWRVQTGVVGPRSLAVVHHNLRPARDGCQQQGEQQRWPPHGATVAITGARCQLCAQTGACRLPADHTGQAGMLAPFLSVPCLFHLFSSFSLVKCSVTVMGKSLQP